MSITPKERIIYFSVIKTDLVDPYKNVEQGNPRRIGEIYEKENGEIGY